MRYPNAPGLPTTSKSRQFLANMITLTNNLTLRRRLANLPEQLDGIRRRTIVACFLGVLTFIVIGLRVARPHPPPLPDGTQYRKSWRDELPFVGEYGPRNATLGFQKIYYLTMPDRTDRQDMMTLIAGYLNLEFTPVFAVDGTNIPDKAKPYDVKHPPKNTVRPSELGCWRSHANVWSHMVSHGITSALILEDDIDLSSGIRDTMDLISTHLTQLTASTSTSHPRQSQSQSQEPDSPPLPPSYPEPYGLSSPTAWDVLSLGHCYYGGGESPPPSTHPHSSRIFSAYEDPYARRSSWSSLLPSARSARVRVLRPTWSVFCTQGYALTKSGAMRLLYNVGGPGGVLDMPVDMVMAEKFRAGLLRGWVALPSVMAQWKWGDWRDTDVQDEPKEEEEEGGEGKGGKGKGKKKGGSGPDVVGSVREEIARRLGPGGRDVWKEMEGGK